jgi:hypothetical protein
MAHDAAGAPLDASCHEQDDDPPARRTDQLRLSACRHALGGVSGQTLSVIDVSIRGRVALKTVDDDAGHQRFEITERTTGGWLRSTLTVTQLGKVEPCRRVNEEPEHGLL